MNRDNHDKQMLKAMQRIARSLESLVQIEMIVHKDLISNHNENNKLEYPDYCDEDVRCDEVCDGAGCPYLNEDGECNIANAMAYREYKNQKIAKEQK